MTDQERKPTEYPPDIELTVNVDEWFYVHKFRLRIRAKKLHGNQYRLAIRLPVNEKEEEE